MLIDGNFCTHLFIFYKNALGTRVLEHEDLFFSATWDIPETEWLERAIYYFNTARSKALAAGSLEPLAILVKDTNSYQVNWADRKEEPIVVEEVGTFRKAIWANGECDAHLEPPGFWKTAFDSDSLLNAILMLHQSIHPKYKVDQADRI